MLYKHLFVLCCFVVVPLSAAQAESLRYEKIFNQVTAKDNRLILSVDENGSVALHRPLFMTRSGDYQWQLDAQALNTLWSLMDQQSLAQVDQALLNRNLAQLKQTVLVSTSNTDISYFEWVANASTEMHSLEVEGLEAWAGIFKDQSDLQILQRIEQDLWQWINLQLQQEGVQ